MRLPGRLDGDGDQDVLARVRVHAQVEERAGELPAAGTADGSATSESSEPTSEWASPTRATADRPRLSCGLYLADTGRDPGPRRRGRVGAPRPGSPRSAPTRQGTRVPGPRPALANARHLCRLRQPLSDRKS